MIRILVADDHAVVRQGMIQILADVKDMLVKDEAQNGVETLDRKMERIMGEKFAEKMEDSE